MDIFNPAKLLSRMVQPGAASKVARELGGAKALEDLLVQAGYAGNPQGLSKRFLTELKTALPLCLDPAAVRAFGSHFEGPKIMAAARREAAAMPAPDRKPDLRPASLIEPSPEEIAQNWPWLSGQAAARLAAAGLAGGDGELARDALRSMKRTGGQYPPLLGLGWARPDWPALRALNWLFALRFLAEQGRVDHKAVVRCVLHLQITGMVLEQSLSSKKGAYAPGDAPSAGALLFLAVALAFLPGAKAWLKLGSAALGPSLQAWSRDEGPKPSGRLHPAAACQWGGLGLWLGMKHDLKLPRAVAGLRQLAAACRAMAPPWGDGSTWGQARRGGVWGLEDGGTDPFTNAANLAALLLKEPAIRAGRVLDQRLYWLFGTGAYEALRQLAGGAPPGAVGLEGAEIAAIGAMSQGRRVGLQLNLGAAGEPGRAGALAMGIIMDGLPLLQRPGRASGGPLADYLGSRQAHNTLVMDKKEPGPGRVRLEGMDVEPGHAFISASYDGYGDLPDPVLLRRRLFLDISTGIITVVDQIQSAAEHLCQIFFHLPPEAELTETGRGDVLIQGAFGRVLFTPDTGAVLNRAKGDTNPPLGWRSREEGQAEPSHSLVVGANIVGRVSLTNTFKIL